MQLFDLHCDTLYRAVTEGSDFNDPDFHISLEKAQDIDRYVQFMAVWTPDSIKGPKRTEHFLKCVSYFKENRVFNDKIRMYLSVENAGMLNGDIKNLHLLKDNDVKAVTLTWNDFNELGSGVRADIDSGITDFGKDTVRYLSDNNIAVDVSHASDRLFYDIVKNSTGPLIASHSNSRYVAPDKRNLTDEMFSVIRDRKGLVGLNFYRGFLNREEDKASIDDLIRHAEHFLKLGGVNVLSIGADFDGADMPDDIKGIDDMQKIYKKFTDYFGTEITDKIFYENSAKFFNFFD